MGNVRQAVKCVLRVRCISGPGRAARPRSALADRPVWKCGSARESTSSLFRCAPESSSAMSGLCGGDEEMKESRSAPGEPDALRREFAGWDPCLQQLLDARIPACELASKSIGLAGCRPGFFHLLVRRHKPDIADELSGAHRKSDEVLSLAEPHLPTVGRPMRNVVVRHQAPICNGP